MGSSTKRKKEKKQDFQKPKLKVGKIKSKPANFTDTSFKAKSVVLQRQSISTEVPSASSQFTHHLSLLKHRSDSQKCDSLSFLTKAIKATAPAATLPEPVSALLPRLQGLFQDSSKSVQVRLLILLKSLPPVEVAKYVAVAQDTPQILLVTRASMMHLSGDIQMFSMEILEWLLQAAGPEVVGSKGGWSQTLNCFLRLFGWQEQSTSDHSGWSQFNQTSRQKLGGESKAFSQQLHTLATFIHAGIGQIATQGNHNFQADFKGTFPFCHQTQHRLPKHANAFAALNLFGIPQDEENAIYQDREDRQSIFQKLFRLAIERGLDAAKKEGGEIGRAAAAVRKAIDEGMSDYEG